MEIALIVLVFIALLLYIVWVPFFKGMNKNSVQGLSKKNIRDETNVELYKEHKAEIEKDFNDGGIDEENYQYLLAELDSGLLQDIELEEKKPSITVSDKGFSVLWPLCLSVFIVAFSIALYLKTRYVNCFNDFTKYSNSRINRCLESKKLKRNRLKCSLILKNYSNI